MKNKPLLFAGLMGLGLSMPLSAHSRWIVPSHTILSGKETETVSFDLSVSNDIFHVDRPFGGKPKVKPGQAKSQAPRGRGEVKLQVLLPDGKIVDNIELTQAGRKSVASFDLEQSGTYVFSVEQSPSKMTVYEGADGKSARKFGDFFKIKDLPSGSKNLRYILMSSRLETWVSRNGQQRKNDKPKAEGIDIGITPHPNDLFVGETSEIQVYLNGKPAPKDVAVALIPDGTRYRNDRGVIELKTDEKGKVSLKWSQAGLYLVEIEHSIPASKGKDFEERHSLFATLEANPS